MNVLFPRDPFSLLLKDPQGRGPLSANLTVCGGLAHLGCVYIHDAYPRKDQSAVTVFQESEEAFLSLLLSLFPTLFSRKTNFSIDPCHWITGRQLGLVIHYPYVGLPRWC